MVKIKIKPGVLENTQETDLTEIVAKILYDLGYPLLQGKACCNTTVAVNGQKIQYNATTNKFELV